MMRRLLFACQYIAALWECRDHAAAVYIARLARRPRLNRGARRKPTTTTTHRRPTP